MNKPMLNLAIAGAAMNSVETDERQETARGMVLPLPNLLPPQITFNRHELSQILALYGRMVACGEWRDYAMDFLKDRAVFSVFRRSSEVPLYRIVKDPALARRQGEYAVLASAGQVLKRGGNLEHVLKVLEKTNLKLV
jgi:hypothetical protein